MNHLEFVDLPQGDPRWAEALPVLQQLRPHLTARELDEVLTEGARQGLRFLGAFDGADCLGVAGWRIIVNTSVGRKLYIDDLVTTSRARSRAVGARLLSELTSRARAAGARSLELDSGVQRHDAHRFYLRERMIIDAHHFFLPLHDERGA